MRWFSALFRSWMSIFIAKLRHSEIVSGILRSSKALAVLPAKEYVPFV
jgi:hypothetical protein